MSPRYERFHNRLDSLLGICVICGIGTLVAAILSAFTPSNIVVSFGLFCFAVFFFILGYILSFINTTVENIVKEVNDLEKARQLRYRQSVKANEADGFRQLEAYSAKGEEIPETIQAEIQRREFLDLIGYDHSTVRSEDKDFLRRELDKPYKVRQFIMELGALPQAVIWATIHGRATGVHIPPPKQPETAQTA